jgi:hypothetical protein
VTAFVVSGSITMGTVIDVIEFLRDVRVIKGNTVDHSGIMHYSESISLILGLSAEESVKEVLDYLIKNGYVMVG